MKFCMRISKGAPASLGGMPHPFHFIKGLLSQKPFEFPTINHIYYCSLLGWSGGAKVSCILCHRGVQLILAYSWARPAILVAGKGREVMFLFLLFLHFHSCSSFFPVPLFHLFCFLFCRFFSLSLGDDTKWPTRVDVSLNPNTIKILVIRHIQWQGVSRGHAPPPPVYISLNISETVQIPTI